MIKTRRHSPTIYSLIVALALSLPHLPDTVANAATRYVATTGNDANSCVTSQTITTPKKTIVSGISCMVAGDTLYIRGGVYTDVLVAGTSGFPSGTSWTNAVTIAAYPGETVTIRPTGGYGPVQLNYLSQYIIFDGLHFDDINGSGGDAAVSLNQGTHHIRFQNCEIANAYRHGVGLWWGNINGLSSDYNEFINCHIHHTGRVDTISTPDVAPGFGRGHGFYMTTSNNLIEGCTIDHAGEYGVHIYNGNYPTKFANSNTIRKNIFFSNGQNTTRYGSNCCGSMVLSSGTGNIAYNNIIHNEVWNGITLAPSGFGHRAYNNTIYNLGKIGIFVDGATNAVAKNNITYPNVIVNNGTGTVLSNNLTSDPQFVDAAANDFHLLSTSPAINQGATLTEVTTDIAAVPRPQGSAYDIGAYELADTSTMPISSPQNLRVN